MTDAPPDAAVHERADSTSLDSSTRNRQQDERHVPRVPAESAGQVSELPTKRPLPNSGRNQVAPGGQMGSSGPKRRNTRPGTQNMPPASKNTTKKAEVEDVIAEAAITAASAAQNANKKKILQNTRDNERG